MRILVLLCVFCASAEVEAAYVLKNGHFINVNDVALFPVERHFEMGLDALKKKNWDEAQRQFRIVTISFENSSLALEAHYYLGVALYEKGELDIANDAFSCYVKKANSTAHFEDVQRYKLSIAEHLATGYKRHMFGWESLPRILSGKDEALEIFDEVSSSLPNHELAAVALTKKALLLREREEFANAIDAYQAVIRRFPRTSYALKAFQGIAESYVEEIKLEPHNVDALALAEINVKESKLHFPQALELQGIENCLKEMQEIYAKALFETGQLYERMSELKASALYYHAALAQYPSSNAAALCKERLERLAPQINELKLQG